MKRQFMWYSDPGHAWLRVKKSHLKLLGIEDQITSYSYQKNNWVYLEEDLDAPLFITVAKENGWDMYIKESYCAHSSIREYDHYTI